MSLLSEVRELEGKHLISGLFAFLAIIAPGFLIVYHFHPELIEKYDVVKLLLFSAALTLPALFINMLIAFGTHPNTEKYDHKAGLLLASMGNIGVLYTGIAASYLFQFDFRDSLKVVGWSFLPFALFAKLAQKEDKKSNPKPAEVTTPVP